MTWQAPWVWAGALAIVLPIVIHLLGEGRARRLLFPSLQFFGTGRPLPIQRTRLRDLLLLLVRVGIILSAVAALAQPLFRSANRRAGFDASRARAVIADTSTSMQRKIVAGTAALSAAITAATTLADSAPAAILLKTNNPGAAIPGAIAWLRRQQGSGELVIVSDFQSGQVDSIDVASVPADIGVTLHRIPIDSTVPIQPILLQSDGRIVDARVVQSPGLTEAAWSATPARSQLPITFIAAPGDSASVAAANVAAASIGVPLPLDERRRIAIVYPDAPEQADLRRRSAPLRAPWMADLVARMASNPGLDDGARAVTARSDSVDGQERLLLFSEAPAGSVAAAATIVALRRALSNATPTAELEQGTIAEQRLRSWQRTATARTGPAPDAGLSDGRWFWLIALILLGVESVLRGWGARGPRLETAP